MSHKPAIHSQDLAEPASLWLNPSPFGRSPGLLTPDQSQIDDSRRPHPQRASLQGSGCSVALSFDSQVGVVQYGEDVVHEFHLNDYRSVKDVVEAASHIEQRGGTETRTAFGIEFAR